jgi:diguanylate cyclase (GGDEF)-like protein
MQWPTFDLLAETKPAPAVRLLAWLLGAAAVILLAFLRDETEAEYGIASAALLPIVTVTWVSGRLGGLLLTAVAMVAWTAADIVPGHHSGIWWAPYVNGVMRFLTYSFVTLVVSRLHTALARERRLSSYDALTGVLNRRTFLDIGDAEGDRARRYRHPLAVAFLDLDNFKHVNDANGHHVGDAVLHAVGTALRESLRSTDRVGRIGGDEFAVIFPEIGSDEANEAAIKLAEAVRLGLAGYPPVSASIGIAWFERADRPFADMLRAADEAMYAVKNGGKDGIGVRRLETGGQTRPPAVAEGRV